MSDYQDKKYTKINSRCIKNVRMVKDDEYREREVGEIDFCKMTKQELLQVFDCIDHVASNTDFRGLSSVLIDKNTDNGAADYVCMVGEKYLLKLLKEYLTRNTNVSKHEAFVKVLNATCKLVYRDYDDYEYKDWDEHPHPKQVDVHHDMVGSYSLILTRPIPFKIIKVMEDEVARLKKIEEEKRLSEFDKKHSTTELDELSNSL